ncbi:hypothetical protein [Piscinibacter sakaiensis]|uniref:hypothetical protein n=1 Tax=Piscinibacter sakaiensis TaxID=1547922 RepID=UPI003AAB48E8
MITSVFETGSIVTDANDFSKETTAAEKTEVSFGVKEIDLDASRHRFLRGTKTTRGSCVYLPYAPGAINWVIPQGKAVLSSNFSGCWFAKYKLDGAIRVAHVGTPQCNDLWAEIKTRQGFQLICEFKPTDAVDTKKQFELLSGREGAGGIIIGLITSDDKCFMGFGAYKLDQKLGKSVYTALMWKKMN